MIATCMIILQKFLQILLINFQKMFKFSKTIFGHSRDLRSLDYWHGTLATGGSDKIVNIYSYEKGHLQKITTMDIFQANVLSVKINRAGGPIFLLVGCTDGKIFAFDKQCNPIEIYNHSSSICSIDFINEAHFVTGSWDGKAIVWSVKDSKVLRSYDNHKHAVCVFYNTLNDTIVSSSQDKAINIWRWQDGSLVRRKQSCHADIVRQIAKVQDVGFITCSNDQTLKLWSSDLEQLGTFIGHSAFIFTVKSFSLGRYASGSDDKTIRIWNDSNNQETIQCPASIWQLVIDENDNIFAGLSDGTLRIFTKNMQLVASNQQLAAFEKQVMESASKKSGMKAQDIAKLPTTAAMSTTKGKKDGQIRVFRNGGVPEAYMWQNNNWKKIGQVITEHNQGGGVSRQPRYYQGDKYFQAGQYDYIFDVEDESGLRKLIPFNDGANALQAAQKYCMRQGLSKGYLEQIRKFLMQNSSNIPRTKQKQQGPKKIASNQLLCTPQMSIIQFTDVKNPQALFQKIKQFNESIEGNKLSDIQLGHAERIASLLQKSSNYYTWTLDFKELDTLKKLLKWPKQKKFPVWDMLRAYLKHYQSETLFSGLDSGQQIVSQLALGLQLQFPEPIYGLILKTLANLSIQNSNKLSLLRYSDMIFGSIRQISKRNLQKQVFLNSMASFLFNFSVVSLEKKLEKEQILKDFANVLQLRLSCDQNIQNRRLMLIAGSNVLSKYRQSMANDMKFLKKYLLGDEISKDIELLLS